MFRDSVPDSFILAVHLCRSAVRTDLMLELSSELWSQLRSSRGDAGWIPEWIEGAQRLSSNARLSSNVPGDDWACAIADVCHDWSTYDSTYAVTPHLVKICESFPEKAFFRIRLLSMLGWFTACLHLNQTEAAEDLKRWHFIALPRALDLALKSTPYTDTGRNGPLVTQLHSLLGACAAFREDYELAFILYELDGHGTKCSNCNSFFYPFRSGLNPYFK